MINPKSYNDFIISIDELMGKARALGLWRTARKLHKALNEARSERFEAQPRDDLDIEITFGPVREQNLKPRE